MEVQFERSAIADLLHEDNQHLFQLINKINTLRSMT